jgi:predicted aldo/keto reductase-like oxidoreductase
MKYRTFGNLDWKASILGFGAMRMPTLPNGTINEPESIRMIRHAIDSGINYIDTAYVYHGGASETLVGKALADGYREKVKIATKSPIWSVNTPEDFDRILDEQLARLATDHIDFYLMHCVNTWGWGHIKELGLIKKAEDARAAGKINHIGFSFHDKFKLFKEVIDEYHGWEFCQIQYNYMDTENQAGTKGLLYAAERGIPVVVMEPILGGRLANPPKKIMDVITAYPERRAPAEWALRWIWNHPQVNIVLSGMSTMEQLDENLKAADSSDMHVMSEKDFAMIAEVHDRFKERLLIPCTHCDYCMPCPSGIVIPWVFDIYNDGKIYDDIEGSRFAYKTFVPEKARADNCTGCATCESKCPQSIQISGLMPKVHGTLAEGKPY